MNRSRTIPCSRGRHYTISCDGAQYKQPWRASSDQNTQCKGQEHRRSMEDSPPTALSLFQSTSTWAMILLYGKMRPKCICFFFLVTVYLDLSLVGLHRWVSVTCWLYTLDLQTLVLPADLFWEARRFGVLDPPFCDCWKFVTPFSKLQSCFSCLHGISMLMYKDKNKVK